MKILLITFLYEPEPGGWHPLPYLLLALSLPGQGFTRSLVRSAWNLRSSFNRRTTSRDYFLQKAGVFTAASQPGGKANR